MARDSRSWIEGSHLESRKAGSGKTLEATVGIHVYPMSSWTVDSAQERDQIYTLERSFCPPCGCGDEDTGGDRRTDAGSPRQGAVPALQGKEGSWV